MSNVPHPLNAIADRLPQVDLLVAAINFNPNSSPVEVIAKADGSIPAKVFMHGILVGLGALSPDGTERRPLLDRWSELRVKKVAPAADGHVTAPASDPAAKAKETIGTLWKTLAAVLGVADMKTLKAFLDLVGSGRAGHVAMISPPEPIILLAMNTLLATAPEADPAPAPTASIPANPN